MILWISLITIIISSTLLGAKIGRLFGNINHDHFCEGGVFGFVFGIILGLSTIILFRGLLSTISPKTDNVPDAPTGDIQEKNDEIEETNETTTNNTNSNIEQWNNLCIIQIKNHTSKTFTKIFTVSQGKSEWEQRIIHMNGSFLELSLNTSTTNIYTIKLVDHNGSIYLKSNVIISNNLILTFTENDRFLLVKNRFD